MIEYVHVPTARLPGYRSLYDRYLRFFMAAFYWTEMLAAIQSVPA